MRPAGVPAGFSGRASSEVCSARPPTILPGRSVLQPTTVQVRGVSFSARFSQTRGVEEDRGHAPAAGEEMESELEAIQERLRQLKRRLEARESVVALDDPAESIASGDPVSMNPLTAPSSSSDPRD